VSLSLTPSHLQPLKGEVEYGLQRNSTIKLVKTGVLRQKDVCDAHPELLRIAKNWGRATNRKCPICSQCELLNTLFLFGAGLPKSGLPVTTAADLKAALRYEKHPVCYVVEVCLTCKWNHLIKAFRARLSTEVIGDRLNG
jgi:hypothetical protein